MTPPPARPKIYHITHIDNLPDILGDGCLVSDREMIRRGGPRRSIGMSAIKRRRVEKIVVPCHPGTKVGDYVPFYFCPRSIMLFVIHCPNHPELAYRGGQGPIVHLEADLHRVIEWAEFERFPFDLVDRIGVQSPAVRRRATAALADGDRDLPIDVCPDWYF